MVIAERRRRRPGSRCGNLDEIDIWAEAVVGRRAGRGDTKHEKKKSSKFAASLVRSREPGEGRDAKVGAQGPRIDLSRIQRSN
jgi:hypothetical protein